MAYTAITLIKKTEWVGIFGDIVEGHVRRQVFAEEKSVGMTEVYQAMALGYKPEIKFVLENFLDYHGEELVEYAPFMSQEPIILRVLRTYRNGDQIELTCYQDNSNPKASPEPGPEVN